MERENIERQNRGAAVELVNRIGDAFESPYDLGIELNRFAEVFNFGSDISAERRELMRDLITRIILSTLPDGQLVVCEKDLEGDLGKNPELDKLLHPVHIFLRDIINGEVKSFYFAGNTAIECRSIKSGEFIDAGFSLF